MKAALLYKYTIGRQAMAMSRLERGGRMERLVTRLAGIGIDVALLRNPANVFYGSGFRAITDSRPVLLVLKADPVLVVPTLEAENARRCSPVAEIRPYEDRISGRSSPLEGALAVALDCLEELVPKGMIGFEAWSLSQGAWSAMARRLGAGRLRAIDGIVRENRLVKEAAEIASIRRGCELGDWAMAWLVEHSRPGMTELELKLQGLAAFSREAESRFPGRSIRPGARPIFGAHGVLPHAASGATVLHEGDVVIQGVGFTVDGYHSENERSHFVGGDPSPEGLRAYDAATEAQRVALAALRPGLACAEVHRRACRCLEERGYGSFILHRTGHGMGIDAHEPPYLAEGNDMRLEAGMIVTCEPGIYLPGLGGFRHSDTVLITDEGAEVLTRSPRWPELQNVA